MMFFTCSAWFLLDSSKCKKDKICQLILDIWLISVCILGIVLVDRSGNLNRSTIIRQLFPTLYANNWYMTCYLLFYAIHPFLNWVIREANQKTLLRTAITLFFLYSIMSVGNQLFRVFVDVDVDLYSSDLIVWITIYFIIAYMKYFLPEMAEDRRLNIRLLIIGFLGVFGVVALINFVGLKISWLSNRLQSWRTACNPFMVMMVIGGFNLSRMLQFKRRIISYIASLSLFIYLIHENMLLRWYYRPAIWHYVYVHFGYEHLLGWTILIFVFVLIASILASVIYQKTLHVFSAWLSGRIYHGISTSWRKLEDRLLR